MSNEHSDEKKFNDALKRMLQSPPRPHETGKAEKSQGAKKKPAKTSSDASSKQ